MKQSRFDEILKQKMDDLKVDPPSGVWDRIESSLATLTAITTATIAAATVAKAATSTAVKGAKAWSLWSIGGAVASTVAVGVVAVSLVVFNRPEPTPIAKKQSVENIVPVADSLTEQSEELASVVYNKSQKIEYVIDTLDKVDPIFESEPAHPKPEPVPEPKVEPQQKGYNPPSVAKAKRGKRIHTIGLYAANIGGGSSQTSNQYGYATRLSSDYSRESGGIESFSSTTVSSAQGVRHYSPIGAGVAFLWKTTPRLGIESGITYSYLRSDYTIGASSSTVKRIQELHYLGLPLGVKYDFVRFGRVSLYGKAGGKLEWSVAGKNRYEKRYADQTMAQNHSENINIQGVIPSVNIAVGGEYHISPLFGLYFEPSANYYFRNNSLADNYLSQNRVSVNFNAGLRISIN